MATQFATPEQTSQPISPAPAQPSGSGSGNPYLVYPADMKDTQDRIKFSVYSVKTIPYGESNLAIPQITDPGFDLQSGPDFGPVFLPIQPSINDQNTVSWQPGELNPIEKYAVNEALKVMNTKNIGTIVGQFGGALAGLIGSKDFKGVAQLALAEQAVGVQGLLSRVNGQVLNPNLELLFQGPQLRPFQFQFKLSPRNKDEASRVKKIIKFFKKNMAVKKGGEFFLKAPYVFGVEYQHGTSTHQSINLIKKCALQSCSVDYTPLGSYMTYNDTDATMVSYNISLQFQEIVPVYDTDYDDHPIGY
jgi:hypothetical protein